MNKNFNIRFHGVDLEVPEWTKYVAQDPNGAIYAFQDKPILLRNFKSWSVLVGFCTKLEDANTTATSAPSCLDVDKRNYFYE